MSSYVASHTGSSESIEGACMMIHVKALNAGHTQVTVYYEEGPDRLQASVTIAAYVALKVKKCKLSLLGEVFQIGSSKRGDAPQVKYFACLKGLSAIRKIFKSL